MAYYADAPQKPKELRLRLQQDKNMFQRLTDWARDFNPENWTAFVSNHHSQVMASLDRNGKLSQKECDELNAKNEEYLQKKMDSFMQKAKKSFQITPQDTPEAVKLKMGVYYLLMGWLADLFCWLIRKIQEIFQEINKAIQWCWQKAKELFTYLYSFFK